MQTLIASVLNVFFAQLALSDEYISEYQKVLKARGYPTEHEEEHCPVQETQLSSTVTQVDFLKILFYFSFHVHSYVRPFP